MLFIHQHAVEWIVMVTYLMLHAQTARDLRFANLVRFSVLGGLHHVPGAGDRALLLGRHERHLWRGDAQEYRRSVRAAGVCARADVLPLQDTRGSWSVVTCGHAAYVTIVTQL